MPKKKPTKKKSRPKKKGTKKLKGKLSADPDGFTLEVLDSEEGKQIVRQNGTGRFLAGTNTGGRPKGSVDGIALVRALFVRHMDAMSVKGAEFDQLIEELKRSKGGVWRLLRMGLQMSRDERAAAAGALVNVQGASAINIVIVEETPPPAKHVASRVVENDGNAQKTD